MRSGFLLTGNKAQCFGCEACAQICPVGAISMQADDEGFRYPKINHFCCVQCKQCEKVCPATSVNFEPQQSRMTFGGYVLDEKLKDESTSGGFYSAIVNAWADDETIIFGAEAKGLEVEHHWIKGPVKLTRFRKSKYSQSHLNSVYRDVRQFLLEGKRVCFSGTPCQVVGLKNYLGALKQDNLLTIEVVCEGVPSPLYLKLFKKHLETHYDASIRELDYRYKDGRKWDFEVMKVSLQNAHGKILTWKKDRWFNPFWSIWLQHLMSRPSCYQCPFAQQKRYADITLGDLWGVHLYCPELYGRNGGASIAFCNTPKGQDAFMLAFPKLYGHELNFEDALRYQGPLRNHIAMNPQRETFMLDLKTMDYKTLTKKWAKPISFKLWFSKYLWGNRQKVWFWELFNSTFKK